MIIRGQPHDVYNYIAVGLDISDQLAQLGFHALYMTKNVFYYQRTPELMSVYRNILRKEGR